MEDAEFALFALGTATTTARGVVDELRSQGKKAGLIKLRFMRPFPEKELLEAATEPQGPGRLRPFGRLQLALARCSPRRGGALGSGCPITDHIAGLGGRDLTPEDGEGHVRPGRGKHGEGSRIRDVYWHGLRGEQR